MSLAAARSVSSGVTAPEETRDPVLDRLMALPGHVTVPARGMTMIVVPSFLDAPVCAALAALIDAGAQRSTLFEGVNDFRTSDSCNFDPRHPLVQAVEARIAAATGIDPLHGETMQGQRYAPGQQFRPHHDYFHTDQPYWPAEERRGGQRTWTVMIYLGLPEKGGETEFPRAGVRLAPRLGTLVAWRNLTAGGEPDPATLHHGMPVEAGMKYVVTKWYRERPWR